MMTDFILETALFYKGQLSIQPPPRSPFPAPSSVLPRGGLPLLARPTCAACSYQCQYHVNKPGTVR